MPGRAALAAGALLLLTGCGALGTGRRAPASLEEVLSPGPGRDGISAEAEVTFSMTGRRVSLPGAVLLSAPSAFRVDLLDPLDRPKAIVFADSQEIVQYVPAALAAARLRPFPAACGTLLPAAWVPYALGTGPPVPQRPKFRSLSWLGRLSFQRREGGELREQIDCGADERGWFAEKVTWYCEGHPVMKVIMDRPDREGEGGTPRRFTVRYPSAGLKIDFALKSVAGEAAVAPDLLRPSLPPGTRWTAFDLVQER